MAPVLTASIISERNLLLEYVDPLIVYQDVLENNCVRY